MSGYTEEQQSAYKENLNQLKEEFSKRYEDTPQQKTCKLEEFQILKTIGKGGFGKVVLVKNSSDDYYAMKILDKTKIINSKQLLHTLNERKILHAVNFNFVVYMVFSFKDNRYIYFVMPYINGGDMFNELRKNGKFEEDLAKFYASQIVLALEYLHNCSLVYRDLKPENILVDAAGYLKITDFGFCKVIKHRTYTMCGTRQYLAPEMILCKPYGTTVDWWSFGILVYEMNAGYPPFESKNTTALCEMIVAGKFKFAPQFGSDLRDLLTNTIQVDVTRRFGNLSNGILDFKNHRWFASINWDSVLEGRVIPSFVPEPREAGNVENFQKFADKELIPSPICLYEEEFKDF